ncbi:MAG: hypothetical protein JXB23_17040 [Candidatus Aminicenantes bacterium]|nr:hypothetical protein [Candidatus Aminicenantes bacterium]
MFRARAFCVFSIVAVVVLYAGLGFCQDTAKLNTDHFKNIRLRQIGPASFGGRIDDVEAVVGKPHIIYIAAASGGIFKSDDNATTWTPVFDEEGTSLSIGDIAVAPTDEDIVWAGTGEPNGRQSSSWGDGVYKSIDGGETWRSMGLADTHHIGRIAIHPGNPDIVFVAALGHLWGPNEERGLFRTKDGGKTWEKVLFINEDTGAVDIVVEDKGRVLYAAMYQRRRRAWGFVGGGPHSGLYRSLDGGDTWQKLTKGLPDGDTGRIGIAIAKSHPNIVYAIFENKNGGVYRSEDRGNTWTFMNELNPRPMYYSQIRVDPKNFNKVWVLGTYLYVSIDGGRTFTKKNTGEKIHVDHHALWINPDNPDHLLLGNDGGFYISYNGSKTWDFIDNLPIAQFYAIGIDTRSPYWVYGGAQDHGAYGLPSKNYSRLGITNADVLNVVYGDAFHVVVDPENPHLVYAENQEGRLLFLNLKTGEERYISPISENPEEKYSFGWKCPLIMSPHDSMTVFYGANKLLKTVNQGNSWSEISPDLTKNQDWKKLPIMGLERNEDTLSRDDGIAHFGTLTTISESPLQSGLIFTGTDDGNVWMTPDGGQKWNNLTPRFRLPGPRWVSCVLASVHNTNTAYVTFDGHRDDDFVPYIFKTMDSGVTWASIAGDIPKGMAVNVVREHPWNPNLLFLGTEFGLFLSMNGGKNWVLFGGDLPRVPIDDIVVNGEENDLILGTHGRGIIILDDITMLENLDDSVLGSEAHLFPVREAIEFFEARELPNPGASKFSGPNPDFGALITYYLKNNPSTEDAEKTDASKKNNDEAGGPHVKITISDAKGTTVRELDGPDCKGFNRINWDLRYGLSFDPEGTSPGYFEPKKGVFVLPGEYVATLHARGLELSQKIKVSIDPRISTNMYWLRQRFDISMTVSDMQRAFSEGRDATRKMSSELLRIKDVLKDRDDVPKKVSAKIDEISKELDEIGKAFKQDWYGMEFAIMDLAGKLQATTAPPTPAQRILVRQLSEKLEAHVKRINELITREFPDLQVELVSKGVSLFVSRPIEFPRRY